MSRGLLRLLGALHARGFHPAVLAGLVMMPAVVAVGFVADRLHPAGVAPVPFAAGELRGSFDDSRNHAVAIRPTF